MTQVDETKYYCPACGEEVEYLLGCVNIDFSLRLHDNPNHDIDLESDYSDMCDFHCPYCSEVLGDDVLEEAIKALKRK
jgi:predicted RNA-binding Zn-ribbon protein involved in translation (DUF1610 family)